MSIILYSFKTAFRRPRLLLGIILGIMLGVSLLTAGFMTIDYLGYAGIKKELDRVKVDMRVNVDSPSDEFIESLSDLVQDIEDIDGVNVCFPVLSVNLLGINIVSDKGVSVDSGYFSYYPTIYGLPEHSKIGYIDLINGSLDLKKGEIALGIDLAKLLEVNVGDNITLIFPTFGSFGVGSLNITYRVRGVLRIRDKIWDSLMYEYQGLFSGTVITRQTMSWKNPNLALLGNISYVYNCIKEMQNMSNVEISLKHRIIINIFVNRDKLINPWNLYESINRIRDINYKIELVLQNYVGESEYYYVQDFLTYSLFFYSISVMSARLNITMLLIPALALGGILALIAIWLSINERRREIGLLRVKGAKGSQISTMLFTEAISSGILSGFLGGISGYLTAITLIKVQWFDIAKQYMPEAILSHFVQFYVIAGIIIGGILGLLAVFIPARRVSKISILEALQEYSEELEAKFEIGKLTWILFAMGVYSLLEIGLGLPVLRFVTITLIHGGLFLLIFIGVIFFPIEFFLIYAGPMIFTYTSSKLIGAYASKLRRVFYILSKLFSRELNYVSVRNFIRKKARVSRVIFLIALMLSFTVYYGIAAATNENRVRINTELAVGSDIHVEFYSNVPYDTLINLTENISRLEGVKDVCKVIHLPLYSEVYRERNIPVSVIGLDANYFNVTFMENGYLEDITIKEAEGKFASGDILLSVNLKRYFGKVKGGTFTLTNKLTNKKYNPIIAGFIKFAPGITDDIFALQTDYYPIAFINNKVALELINSTEGISAKSLLIDVIDGYNQSAIVEYIGNITTKLGYQASVSTFEEELEARLSFGFQNISNYFVKIEFFFSLIIAFIGMALIMTISVYERRREIALLVTRGAAFIQILGAFLGEAFLIVVLGFGLGLLVATVYSYGFLVGMLQPTWIGALPYDFPPGYAIVIPHYLIYALVFGFLAFLLFSVIPLILLSKKTISDELRIHH